MGRWGGALAALLLVAACQSKPLPPPVTAAAIAQAPVDRGAEALVLLADPAHAEAVRRVLRDSRFARVDILTDAAEVPARVAEMLSRPGQAGDRRLVWINDGSGESCPREAIAPQPPTVATLFLGPTCLARTVRADGPVRSFVVAPDPAVPHALDESASPPLVFLALPGDQAGARAAEAAILSALAHTDAAPARLLEALRGGIHGEDGYVPRLQASPPAAVWFAGFLSTRRE